MSQHRHSARIGFFRSKGRRVVALALGLSLLLVVLLGRVPVLAHSETPLGPTATWQVMTVASEGDTGTQTDIAVDGNDMPHITFFDESDSAVTYAVWNGSAWSQTPLATLGTAPHKDTALVLDAGGNPHVAYPSANPCALGYTWWSGKAWQTEYLNLRSGCPFSANLVLQSNGRPCISYYVWTTEGRLRYACKQADGWPSFDSGVDTVDYPLSNPLMAAHGFGLDAEDERYFVYAREVSGEVWLRYATTAESGGSTWLRENVDTSGGLGPSLALDAAHRPHVAFYSPGEASLNYAVRNADDTWDVETVDAAADVGLFSSLALDADSQPHIAYYDSTNGDLKYAHWNGSQWQVQTVDDTGDVGQYVGLALDSTGTPHISYYDVTNGDLKYATLESQPAPERHPIFLPLVKR